MSIETICDTIKKLFDNARPPFPQLNTVLMACSLIKRPGMSLLTSTANVVADLEKLGIPTGVMPDGSINLSVAQWAAGLKEIQRFIREDMNSQLSIIPGSINIFGNTNVNTGRGVVSNN